MIWGKFWNILDFKTLFEDLWSLAASRGYPWNRSPFVYARLIIILAFYTLVDYAKQVSFAFSWLHATRTTSKLSVSFDIYAPNYGRIWRGVFLLFKRIFFFFFKLSKLTHLAKNSFLIFFAFSINFYQDFLNSSTASKKNASYWGQSSSSTGSFDVDASGGGSDNDSGSGSGSVYVLPWMQPMLGQ